MGKPLAVAAVFALASGCNFGARSFTCADDNQCGAGGQCELTFGYCSFSDGSCPGGRRFGDLAGDVSNQCVGDNTSNPGRPDSGIPIDAPPDTPPPPDARVCFGTAPFEVCLASAPTQPLTIAAETTINTATSPQCVPTMSGAANYCVVAATTISITAKLRGIGTKPLVLLASESITVSGEGLIDVGSHRGDTDIGAGALTGGAACAFDANPSGRGGGAGGSFTGSGGNGGDGAGGGGGTGGRRGATVNAITQLRGGCPGQAGAGGAAGAGGRGGGAVLLIAGSQIDIAVGGINAAGEGGAGGTNMNNTASGAGGGGSGGFIGLDAPTIGAAGLLLASGGGGGEGSGQTSAGAAGQDPNALTRAAGGTNGSPVGGDGGASSEAINVNGGNGNNATSQGGGGGGGGGAGMIKAPASATLTNLAPQRTP